MTFHDVDLGPYPEVKNALTAASITCATRNAHCLSWTYLGLLPNGSRMPASMP